MDIFVGVGGVDLHSGRSGTIVDSQIVVLAACLPCVALDMKQQKDEAHRHQELLHQRSGGQEESEDQTLFN